MVVVEVASAAVEFQRLDDCPDIIARASSDAPAVPWHSETPGALVMAINRYV